MDTGKKERRAEKAQRASHQERRARGKGAKESNGGEQAGAGGVNTRGKRSSNLGMEVREGIQVGSKRVNETKRKHGEASNSKSHGEVSGGQESTEMQRWEQKQDRKSKQLGPVGHHEARDKEKT